MKASESCRTEGVQVPATCPWALRLPGFVQAVAMAVLVGVTVACSDPTGPQTSARGGDDARSGQMNVQLLQSLIHDLERRNVPGLPASPDRDQLAHALGRAGDAVERQDPVRTRLWLSRAGTRVAILRTDLGKDAGYLAELTAIEWTVQSVLREVPQ